MREYTPGQMVERIDRFMSLTTRRPRSRQDRRREEQRRRIRSARMKRFATPGLWIAFAVLVLGVIIYLVVSNMGVANSAYPPVNNISCDQGEQTAFHIHAHVSIYINGKQMEPPAGVGIAPDISCLYWLHTHYPDGIIHIEAPKGAAFTLGDFLKIWSSHFQSLNYPSQLNSTKGWQVYLDGKPYTGDFHKLQLHAHALITLAYNSPGIKPDTTFNWGNL